MKIPQLLMCKYVIRRYKYKELNEYNCIILDVNDALSGTIDYYIGGIYYTYTEEFPKNQILKLLKHYDKTKIKFDGYVAKFETTLQLTNTIGLNDETFKFEIPMIKMAQ